MTEERIRRVLGGLLHCVKENELKEDCGDCPYRDKEDDFCISRLCRDAYGVIVELDRQIAIMEGGAG